MLAADTNVIVRLLLSDDLAQQRAVHRRLERVLAGGDSVAVSVVVLAELSWVLDSVYQYGRADIVTCPCGGRDDAPHLSIDDYSARPRASAPDSTARPAAHAATGPG